MTSYNPIAWVVKRTKLNSKKGVMWDTLVDTHDISWADPFRVFGGVLNIPGRGWVFLPEKCWILDILEPNFEMAQNGIISSSPEAYRIFSLTNH